KMKVAPNQVYVIPPNTNMGIANGELRLMPRVVERGRHMPVDFFFRCLADDQKSNAIGVILSGGDADGSIGFTYIKAEGGLTFAQDPKTAKIESMPVNAILHGSADMVLTVEDMAKEFAKIGARLKDFPALTRSEKQVLSDSEELNKTLQIVKTHSGID